MSPRSGIAGQKKDMCTLVRNCQVSLRKGCAHLRSHQNRLKPDGVWLTVTRDGHEVADKARHEGRRSGFSRDPAEVRGSPARSFHVVGRLGFCPLRPFRVPVPQPCSECLALWVEDAADALLWAMAEIQARSEDPPKGRLRAGAAAGGRVRGQGALRGFLPSPAKN